MTDITWDEPVKLTQRQYDMLKALLNGQHRNDIAANLGLSKHTIKNHLTRLYKALGVNSSLEAVAYVRDRVVLVKE